jgi:hypothetical protein
LKKWFLSKGGLKVKRQHFQTEFGMYLEAASTAFSVKNLEALNTLEVICVGRDDVIKMISSYKAKLISKT